MRSDIATSDVPLINFMLNTVVDIGRDVEPELYRRYLAIVLDGLRPRPPRPAARRARSTSGGFQDALARWKP